MSGKLLGSVCVCLTVATAVQLAAPGGDALKSLLARLDKAAETFQSMSASVEQISYTEVIDNTDKQIGVVRLKRNKTLGLIGRADFSQPNMSVGFLNHQVLRYYPATKVVEVYDVGRHAEQLDQFLLLGFGTSGKDLAKSYKVRLVGEETIAGKRTTHIELTPKAAEALEYFRKAHLWIVDGPMTYAIQEQIFANAKDYTKFTYSNVQLNVPLTDKELELNLPPGVKRITPGK